MPDDTKLSNHPAADLAAILIDGTTASLTGGPVASAGLALARMASTLIAEVGQRRAILAVEAHVDALAELGGVSTDDAYQELRRLLIEGDPAVDDAMYDSFKSLTDSRDQATWPYISLFTASHLRGDCPRTVFRRWCWLLSQCEARDVRTMHLAASACLHEVTKFTTPAVVSWNPTDEGLEIHILDPDQPGRSSHQWRVPGEDDHLRELCDLVNRARLGEPYNNGFVEFRPKFVLPAFQLLAIPCEPDAVMTTP